MGLFRQIIIIKRKRYEIEDPKTYEEKSPKELALVLDEYEDKVLVAILKKAKKGILESNFTIYGAVTGKYFCNLTFQDQIYLIPKENIEKEEIDKLPFSLMNEFVKRLKIYRLNNETTEDYEALRKVLSKYYKKLILEGSVIITLSDKEYKTYFVSEKQEDNMVVYPLEYNKDMGLSIKSFEKEKLSYEIFIDEILYLDEQEEKIRELLKNKTLKLISGRKLNKWVFFLK